MAVAVMKDGVVAAIADTNTFNAAGEPMEYAGCRLVAAAAAAVMRVRRGNVTGEVLYELRALANSFDESLFVVRSDSPLYFELTGAGAVGYLYLEVD